MAQKFSNFARAKLATPPSGTGGLSFTVESGKGALFPTLAAGDHCYLTFKNAARTANEVVKIEARSGDSFTIASGGRGADGTTAATWTANDFVELCLTRVSLAEIEAQAIDSAEPSHLFPYQRWVDTTNGVVKRRNAAGSGWELADTLAETIVAAKSSGYTVAITDYKTLLDCSGTFTLALTAAATLGDGFYCHVRNSGTGTITVDPNGSEQIDGAATLKLWPGDACMLFCNGSAWLTVGLTDGARIIGSAAPSGVATVDFTSGIDNLADCYELDYQLVPATDDVYLRLVVGTGGGPTWQTSGGSYSWGAYMAGVSAGQDGGSTYYSLTTAIALSRPEVGQGVGSDAGEHIAGRVRIWGINTAIEQVLVEGRSAYRRSDSAGVLWTVGGFYGGTGVTALRLEFSSGNIESGSVTLRKLRKGRT